MLAGILPYQGHLEVNNGPKLRQKPIWHRQLINYGEAEPLYPAFLTGQDLLELMAAAKKPAPAQTAELIRCPARCHWLADWFGRAQLACFPVADF